MNRKKYIVWRIIYSFHDRPNKSIRSCWRTDNLTDVRKLAQGINPEAKIRLCYTEFK
nr:MAG TPA: hypothetical protein [Caudoviricetes sp.]DAS19960.1 MAG TPA: hypothetical protein [Caudoviricetes sp.]DAY71518.1 MAG TPA: hypothetical protein [Caudoviricetes sp.]